jgi:hypothetical protein
MRSIRSYLGQQGRSRWGHRKLSERAKNCETLFPHTYMLIPGQARIHTCPPVADMGIDTIASDDGGHRGTGGTGVDSRGGKYKSKFETLCLVADRVVSGHRGAGRCMYVHGIACMCGIYTI